MIGIFSGCSSLTELPNINYWNTNNIIYINKMFSGC